MTQTRRCLCSISWLFCFERSELLSVREFKGSGVSASSRLGRAQGTAAGSETVGLGTRVGVGLVAQRHLALNLPRLEPVPSQSPFSCVDERMLGITSFIVRL